MAFKRRLGFLLLFAVLTACASQGVSTPPSAVGSVTSTTTSGEGISTTSSQVTTSTTSESASVEVLVFHRTEGFRHASIPRAIEVLTQLGSENGFRITSTEDPEAFTETNLVRYQVIVFLNTTGDVLDPPGEEAMQTHIASGGGYVGLHAAADTEYDWAWYGELMGAYFDSHPQPQGAGVDIVAPAHPITGGLPTRFEVTDEWYNFREPPAPDVTILARLDEGSYEGGAMGSDHPIAWAHEFDGGRGVYLGFGHTDQVFDEPVVQSLLVNSISWAAGAGD